MSVGFPNLNPLMRRRTIRAPVNPLDRATIVSIFPKAIIERKVTIQPGLFKLESGSYENPSLLTVGPSSWWKETDEDQPLLEIPNSSIQVADAIVNDYCSGMLAYDRSANRNPGLFFIPGVITIDTLRKEHKKELESAKMKQYNWFTALVSIADMLWAKSNGNPIVISDEMRMAARNLNLNEKDWMKDFKMMEKSNCIACGAPRDVRYPVCPNCHAVTDVKRAEELGIVFATAK